MLNSLRARMTLLFTLSTTLLMVLVSVGILGYIAHDANRRADRLLLSTARRVRSELLEEPGLSAAAILREEGDLLEGAGGAAMILDGRGRVLARSRGPGPPWPRQGDDGWRVLAVRARETTIVAGIPWHRTRAAIRNQAILLGGLVLFVALVTAAGAWILVGRTLNPIRILSRRADAASAEGLRVRLEAPSDDAELVELVTTLNGALERLAQAAAARGRFYAAASHELRTPLQALSGHLELCLTRPRDPEEYLAVIREAYAQTRRLTRLVRELLLLNQLHQGASAPPPEPVELCWLVDRVLDHQRAAFAERGLRVQNDAREEVEILAPPDHAEMVIRNLVENAAKYAVPETTVWLRIDARADGARFEIYNACPDSLVVRPEQLFEPFFRPDASRSSRTGGNGLGLAICKAVATANGWVLTWEREESGVRAAVGFCASRSPTSAPSVGARREESRVCLEKAGGASL